MGRVGPLGRIRNQLTIHCVHFTIILLNISFLSRVLTQPIKFCQLLPYITTHLHFNPHYHTTPHNTPPYPAGFVKDKAETIHQIRPKLPRAEAAQAKTTQSRNDSRLKRSRAETTRYRLWEKSFKLQIAAYNYGYPKFDF